MAGGATTLFGFLGTATLAAVPVLACVLAAAPAQARPLAGLTVNPPAAAPACPALDRPGGRSPDLACLNRQWAAASGSQQPAAFDPAARASGQPPNSLGLYDRAGTAQRLGRNFGHLALPQRRDPDVYPPFGGALARPR